MRRAKLSDNSEKMSLFPFLAVLVCTMGALLVLLVVIAKQAMAEAEQSVVELREQLVADAAVAAEETISSEEAEAARNLLEHRVQVLQTVRDETEQQKRQLRQALSDLEDHMSQLIERLRRAKAAEEELATQSTQSATVQDLEREIAATRAAIEQTRQELAEAQTQSASRKQSYAIIPYQGSNGTKRVPIYLECLSNAVVIQPYGIRLNEQDFNGELNQDNPLASALRAAAGYVARQQNSLGRPSDPPYPLLIVRPSGIRAYYAARAAMGAWTSEFGYELVEDEWPLEFAAGDPHLGTAMFDAVELARRRRSLAGGAGLGGRYAQGGGNGEGINNAANSNGGAFGGNSAADFDQQGSGSAPSGEGGTRAGGATGQRYPAFGAGQSTATEFASPNHEGNRLGGNNLTPGEIENQGGGRDENANNPGEGNESGAVHADAKPMAETRGEGWAELDAGRGATAVTRPVALVISADRVVILSNVNATTGKAIMMPGESSESIDEFVNAVWDHMRGWGIAGRGLYWKPIIKARVSPGGELRAAELQKLLEGSGMEVSFSR